MIRYVKRVRILYSNIIHSIAFYPSLISGALLFLAVEMLFLDKSRFGMKIVPYFRYIINVDADSARSFLATMAGGVISLTVFSFTMVMVTLNQAASNYSPRILPGIISQKDHQVVLGFYLGTIIYLSIILVNVMPGSEITRVPVISLSMGFVLALASLTLFVYFIHTISHNIQISTILKDLYKKTRSVLEQELQTGKYSESASPQTDSGWREYNSPVSGYFQQIQESTFLGVLVEHDLMVQILVPEGLYLVMDTPLLRINAPDAGEDSEIYRKLMSGVIFQDKELPERNYLYGFKQITEIAVKALSPGINDPGTAVNAMDYLSDLLALRMRLPDARELRDDDNRLRVSYVTVPFEDILYYCFAEIRTYGKSDPIIIQKLLWMIVRLLNAAPDELRRRSLVHQARVVVGDAKYYIHNTEDRIRVARMISSIKGLEESAAELYASQEVD